MSQEQSSSDCDLEHDGQDGEEKGYDLFGDEVNSDDEVDAKEIRDYPQNKKLIDMIDFAIEQDMTINKYVTRFEFEADKNKLLLKKSST